MITPFDEFGPVAPPPDYEVYTLRIPEPSSWVLHCAGIQYRPERGKEPNAFHRFAQRLVLGFRWERAE